jgi:hypothetical protein
MKDDGQKVFVCGSGLSGLMMQVLPGGQATISDSRARDQAAAGNDHWRATSLVKRKRSNSAASTLHPFPTFLAWILPLTISFRNVGREMRRYWQASQVLKTCFWPFDEEPLRRRSGLTRRSGILGVFGGITFFLFFRPGPAGTKFEKIAHLLVLDHDSFIGRESVFL